MYVINTVSLYGIILLVIHSYQRNFLIFVDNLRVFLFLFKQFKNTIVCRVSSQKGVILPKLSLSI